MDAQDYLLVIGELTMHNRILESEIEKLQEEVKRLRELKDIQETEVTQITKPGG